ncbi:hypothetical protein IEC97_07460 [Neobacillus cucumis]|nr:hypothetical protein [Neobacillus cucumis]MBI0577195.1 hypothetical protein [Neobacillus cucumis]
MPNLFTCLGVFLVIVLLALALLVGAGIFGLNTSSFDTAFNAIAAQC